MPLGDGTLPHHDNVGCTKMGHQHKVSISTVVALVRAPVHKGVINDAGIAFTLSLARQGRLRASVS
jgi:hypothetical protein